MSLPLLRSLWSRRALVASLGAGVLLAVAAGCGFMEPTLSPLTPETLNPVELPPVHGRTAAFDVMVVDESTQRLYLSDRLDQGVDVVDVSRAPGRYLQTIHLAAAPNGLLLLAKPHVLYAAAGDGTVSVIDAEPTAPRDHAVIKTINTKDDGVADLLDYDPADGKVYVTNPQDGFLTAIDAATGTIVHRVPGLGLLQQPRYDPVDGMLYVVSADRNSLFRINATTDSIAAEYPLPVVCEPHGLAIDPATNQGLIGCNDKDDKVTLAWNFTTQRAIATFDLAGAGDMVVFDQQAQHFYFAASSFDPPEVAVFSAAPITFLTAVPTSARSRTVAYDEADRLIYTFDGRHGEAALWAFPDPVAGCVGTEAQRAAAGAPRSQTPHCHPRARP